MEAVGIIPARLASTRLPEKMLRLLSGKPMIQHVYENATRAASLAAVVVACDDERIQACVESFGGRAILTRPDHVSGTSRISEAAQQVPGDIIVNIQGDEPLLRPEVIDTVVTTLRSSADLIATVYITKHDQEGYHDPNVVKAVITTSGHALYFSRAPVPHDREQRHTTYNKHLGLYAYRRQFLAEYPALPPSALEAKEKLEQLRWLEAGYTIVAAPTTYDSISVDTLEDANAVEQLLSTSKTKA